MPRTRCGDAAERIVEQIKQLVQNLRHSAAGSPSASTKIEKRDARLSAKLRP
jgi:hypothetical protein